MASAHDFYRGQRIGKYEVLTQLSLGGMAELFLAFTSGPGGFRKYVVLKRILPDVNGDDQFVSMFLDEARITAALSHPNVAQVFDLGEEEGLYLAMEFIAGQNLNEVAAACARAGRPIPVGFSCTVARDVLNALHYAHTFTDPTGKQISVIHRDVAQKNVMVAYDGVVKLLDFGIAKVKGRMGRTGVGMVKGTAGYMSPEQVRGEELDGRSDVFAVGVMLHEMLTGRRLFSAPTEMEEMELILTAPIAPAHSFNPLISQELSQVVARGLARERADRFASAREMARALERAAGHLLLDQEQVAAFMRELFEEEMARTRSLLETVGDAAPPVRPPQPRSSAPKVIAAPMRPVRNPAPRKVEAPLPPPEEVPTRVGEPPKKRDARPSGVLWGALFVAVVVGGSFGVWKLVHSLPPAEEHRVEPEDLLPRPLPPWQGSTEPAAAADVEAHEEVEAQVEAAASDERPTRRDPPPKRSVRQGTLTLITHPEATVMRGREVVGKTPLFKAALPEGTHLLRLKGPDGKIRVLSTPIKAGENTAFRMKLADLPKE